MTKSRPSATKRHLSSLFRWLAVLCFIKLAILGMLVFDAPLPHWLGGTPQEHAQEAALQVKPDEGQTEQGENAKEDAPENMRGLVASAEASRADPADQDSPAVTAARSDEPSPALLPLAGEDMPQGAAAAQLAAIARPRQREASAAPALPVPQTPPANRGVNAEPAAFTPPDLPAPAPLGGPTVEAGISAQQENSAPLLAATPRPARSDDGLLDMLGLKNLPIPRLGSVQAAHAAALDMPVPQTPGSASPFAPAEQSAPLTIPGAPDIPANIPRGQGSDGAPLPPRGAAASSTALPSLPQGRAPATLPAPAPQVTPSAIPGDPNSKAQDLARQQQDILMLRQQMDQRLKDLQNAEEKMKDMIREAKTLEDKKIRGLIQMYANMKPRTAAKALENMDERVAIRILSGMPPKQSGEILTYTDPAKTAKFTELITRMRLPD